MALLEARVTEERGESRFYPNPDKPVLIYLPGVHGDATLFRSFRIHAQRQLQVVEFDYPRTLNWSLGRYADFVLEELNRHGIERGWILAESYSSQVAWALSERAGDSGFAAQGIILAGGFVRYPVPALASAAARAIDVLPSQVWQSIFAIYGRYAKFRHRRAPETQVAVNEFIARRTPEDLAAMAHRMRLIAENDPCEVARMVNCPVYLLAGVIDPVVPVWPVLKSLRRDCPRFSGHRIIWPADHNVLATEPEQASSQIIRWIEGESHGQGASKQKPA